MTNVTRRRFFGVSATVAAGTFLTGCAGTSLLSGAGGVNRSGKTLSFLSNHPGTSKHTEQKLIDQFHHKFGDITVNLVDGGKNYEEVATKFRAALSGNDLPDIVVFSDTTWFDFALAGKLQPLDGLFAQAGVDLSDYVDSLVSDYLFEGKHYALPYARSTPLFYYNRDVWHKAGLPDRGPHDWDEFALWAPKISSAIGAGNSALVLPDSTDFISWGWEGPTWSMGGSYSKDWTPTFTDPNTVKAGNYLKTAVSEKKWADLSPQPSNEFGAGIAGAMVESTGSINLVAKAARSKFRFGTAFMPGPVGASCPTGGAGLAIPANISMDRKINALKFINFITNTDSTVTFAKATGYMPVRKSALNDPVMKAFLAEHPNYETAVKQLPVTRRQDSARVVIPNAGKDIDIALGRIAVGADVDSTFSALNKNLQRKFDSQVKPRLPK